MARRLKQALVESYVGAIALGYLLALDIMRFVEIFSAPVGTWAARSELRGVVPRPLSPEGFPFQAALPPLMGFLVLSVLWYLLFRWLYFSPFSEAPSHDADPSTTAH